MHQNGNVIILAKCSSLFAMKVVRMTSLAALKVVQMITSSAVSDETFVKMPFPLKCRYTASGPQFNIKIPSYQYRKSHCGDKMILWPSHLHSGTSYTGKATYLYWIRAIITESQMLSADSSLTSKLGRCPANFHSLWVIVYTVQSLI